jgi:hypothetical protein
MGAFAPMVAFGLTGTVIVNISPVQVPDKGVILYDAVCCVFVGLIKVPEIVPTPDALTAPVKPPVTVGLDQEYIVPKGIMSLTVEEKVKEVALQIAVVELFAIVAFGFTVTVRVKVPPTHPSADFGVTEYVAVCTALVGLVKVPEIVPASAALTPPVNPPVTVGAGQL